MKHKRQTLSKEDGDEKDGGSSDGIEKPKGEKILIMDDDEKKSCHNCDISGVGDVGSTFSSEVSELSSGRGSNSNNNNTPSATNNNTGFNTNSNGASSVGSTNSVSSSFEKMVVEDDSRSQDSSEVTSPCLSTKKSTGEIRVKIEAEHKSPNSTKQQISLGKKSPSANVKELCSVKSNGVLLALPDSTVSTPGQTLPTQGSSARSLTPSSTPGTPSSVQLQQGSPLSMQTPHTAYMQRPRSSPSSTSSVHTSMLHGSSNTGTMSPHSRSIPNNPQVHFQQQNTYQPSTGIDYRNGLPSNRQTVSTLPHQTPPQTTYCSRETYQQRIPYSGEIHPLYTRQSQIAARTSHHPRASGGTRPVYNPAMQFHQQQTQYGSTGDYNGYAQTGSYHAPYHRSMQNSSYPASQGYTNAQTEQGPEAYMPASGYGYPPTGSYHASETINSHGHTGINSQSGQHYYGDMQHQQQQTSENYVNHQTTIHSTPGDYRVGNKCHPNAYYEQTNQIHVHQGGEASNIPSNYVSSPDPFPTPGITTTATAIAAATAAVITPPCSSGQTDTSSEAYGNFGNFYSEPVHANAPPPSADNSNSSSDFNFLSNLANDFAPEYYQLS